jgi:hypothetical protein
MDHHDLLNRPRFEMTADVHEIHTQIALGSWIGVYVDVVGQMNASAAKIQFDWSAGLL